MAISFRISGGKLAATEMDALILGEQVKMSQTSFQDNPIAPKVLPVIEPDPKTFEDELDLAYAVIDGVQTRGEKGNYSTQRVRFYSNSSA